MADGTEVGGVVVPTNAIYFSLSVVLTAILMANLLIGLTVRDIDKIGEMADAAIIAVELKQIYEGTARNALMCRAFNTFINKKPAAKYLTIHPNRTEKRRFNNLWTSAMSILPEYVLQKDLIHKEVRKLAKNRFEYLE